MIRQKCIRPAPSRIEFKGFNFLITDRPSDLTLSRFVYELMKNGVNTVVRVCEPTYNTEKLEAQNINVIDLTYDDGTFPSKCIINQWLTLLKQQYRKNPDDCIAVHCVSGLGRAPLLVAIALLELGVKYEAAVEMIRDKRRGALNAKQLTQLQKYKSRSRLRLIKKSEIYTWLMH